MWERRSFYSPDIIRDCDYINGKIHCNSYGRTKNQAALTVVPEKQSGKINNKPLVHCKISDKPCKVLLDSGSEVNVIDKDFLLHSIGVQMSDLKPLYKSIRCANGSSMAYYGSVNLNVNIGVSTKPISFIVAPNIRPKVILGVRSMKTLGCELDLKKNCAIVQGVQIPFMGTIFPQSLMSSKNGKALQSGTGLQKALW